MSQRIQVRRGTNAARLTTTFSSGELAWVTDNQKLYVGDGITVGGVLATESTTGLVFLTGNQTITETKTFRDNSLRTKEIRNLSGELIIFLQY